MLHRTALGVIVILVAGCGSPAASPQAATGLPQAGGIGAAAPPSAVPSDASSTSTASPTPTRAPTPAPTPIALFDPAPTEPLDAGIAERLQAVVDREVAQGAPDMIAAVVTAEGTWAGAAGIDGPNGRKARATDEFGIASVSKVILAALILKLAEQGKVDLDVPLERYLDGVDVDANGATLRQALAMRSGIGTTKAGAIEQALAECDRPWSTAEVVATIPPPFAAAGSRYEYSNPTYKLVSIAAENASGKKLADALESLVIDPADADRMLLQGPHAGPPKPWALPLEGHGSGVDIARFGTGGSLPCIGFATLAWGASGIASDAPSLARWGWHLFAGDIISADSLDQMTTLEDGVHGLGIDRFNDFAPEIAYGHAGSQAGYSALLTVLPQRQAVIVVFINDEAADPFSRTRHLIDALVD